MDKASWVTGLLVHGTREAEEMNWMWQQVDEVLGSLTKLL